MGYSRSPAEYFVRYLISKRDEASSSETISAILDDHEIVYPGITYIEKLIERMSPFPEPFQAVPSKKHKQEHLVTRQWLKKKGIHDLWYPTEHVQEAFKILGEPRVRALLEDLLLSPMRIEDVVQQANKHFDIKLTIEGVATFRHYFWNKRLLTDDEWITVLEERKPLSTATTIVKLAPDVAHMVVPYVLGLSGPSPNITSGMVAKRMRDIAFEKVLEIERRPASQEHARMMTDYMRVIKEAENESRQSDVALKDVLTAFEKFRLNKDTKPVPSIEQVAKLNYSQSGMGTDREDATKLLDD